MMTEILKNASKKYLLAIIIFLLSILVFARTLQNGFVWDDLRNFIDNPMCKSLSLDNVICFFSSIKCDNYFPLTWISVAIDYWLWQEDPFGYHLSNIFFHGIASAIFFLLCLKVLVFFNFKDFSLYFCSFFISLFYSLHPLRVETVSWISTRGDMLCSIFLQLSLITYLLRYKGNTSETLESYAEKRRASFFLAMSFLFCFFSFLCRAWAIMFPFILLLIDFGTGRFQKNKLRVLLFEKVPFFLLSVIFGLIAFKAKMSGMPSISDFNLLSRVMLLLRNISFYIFKTIFPINLSPLYPISSFVPFAAENIIMSLASISMLLFFVWNARSYPFAICFFSYVLLLLPVSGITLSGIQSSADRYTYISTMPLYLMFAAIFAKFAEGLSLSQNQFYALFQKSFLALIVFAILLLFISISIRQIGVWKDDFTLWSGVIESGNACLDAYYNRGLFLAKKALQETRENKRNELFDKSILDFNKGLEISPDDKHSLLNRAKVLIEKGNLEAALYDLNKILKRESTNAGALSNRAFIFEKLGKTNEAIADLQFILQSDPKNSNAAFRLASICVKIGDIQRAENILSNLIEANSFCATAYVNRGALRLMKNDISSAEGDFRKALSLCPELPEAKHNLAIIEAKKKK